jgi:hypothetical protein
MGGGEAPTADSLQCLQVMPTPPPPQANSWAFLRHDKVSREGAGNLAWQLWASGWSSGCKLAVRP